MWFRFSPMRYYAQLAHALRPFFFLYFAPKASKKRDAPLRSRRHFVSSSLMRLIDRKNCLIGNIYRVKYFSILTSPAFLWTSAHRCMLSFVHVIFSSSNFFLKTSYTFFEVEWRQVENFGEFLWTSVSFSGTFNVTTEPKQSCSLLRFCANQHLWSSYQKSISQLHQSFGTWNVNKIKRRKKVSNDLFSDNGLICVRSCRLCALCK